MQLVGQTTAPERDSILRADAEMREPRANHRTPHQSPGVAVAGKSARAALRGEVFVSQLLTPPPAPDETFFTPEPDED
jgi:hypothetical protein